MEQGGFTLSVYHSFVCFHFKPKHNAKGKRWKVEVFYRALKQTTEVQSTGH
jgi:hypothetical protein